MSSEKRLPDRARAVIVGGGVTGCSIAYHLAHLGWTDIVLLEQHELTAGTTWHAAGLITSAGMTDETALFLSRYSRDLYERLEQETGHSTGFNPVGHVSLATNPQRLDALRRSSAWMHGFGVHEHEISARELQDMWPLLDTSDVLAGFYVPDEGRADPVGVATSMAKGAKALGARVVQGVTVTGVETERGRVTAVNTDQGRIETEVVVNAAGMWARQLGERDGVCIPLQAAEHYYLITDTVPGMAHDLAVIEDPDRYGYYRPEGDGMLVGLFEPVGAPWSLDGVPNDFAFGTLPPDWDRLGPYLDAALARIPSLSEVGVRLFFCGPESFTPDIRPMLGPAPELDGYYVAAGMNSLGILTGGGVGTVMAHWIVDGYYGHDESALTGDGWFDTGDVATIDADGYMVIRDRSKDIIKSGGEWISTVELENIAIAHPGIANAAAIAAFHPKWDQRPVLIAVRVPGGELSEAELIEFYDGKVARWQVPDRVIFVDALPLGATGKVLKNRLREEYGEVLIETS